MNYQSLYQEFKYKQLQGKQLQEHELARIQETSNQPKININSTSILLKRTIQILDQFPDDQSVNLQSSIPILRAVGLLQLLTSVVEAREMLTENPDGMGMEMRLRKEVEFLYYLWDMIDEEEVECRELKQIVELLQSKKKNQLKTILMQIFNNEQKIDHTIKSYLILSTNQQYYKHMNKPIKFHHNNKENSSSLFPQQQSNPLYYSKMDKMERSGELGSPIYDKLSTKSGHKFGTTIDPNMKTNEFVFTCQLNTFQEKDLIQRLYKNDIYKQRQEQKRQKDEERQQAELRECTFKPNLVNRGKSVNKSYNQIKGYDKAINRLKAGSQKNKISKEMRDYKPVGQNYEKLRQKGVNPPKFLERKKKQQERVLFIISFDLGRHKTNVKIRENDTEQSVAERICKIYSLKKQFYQEIRQIVRSQLDAYYEEQEQLMGAGQEIC